MDPLAKLLWVSRAEAMDFEVRDPDLKSNAISFMFQTRNGFCRVAWKGIRPSVKK
jgi:hypothetical protein